MSVSLFPTDDILLEYSKSDGKTSIQMIDVKTLLDQEKSALPRFTLKNLHKAISGSEESLDTIQNIIQHNLHPSQIAKCVSKEDAEISPSERKETCSNEEVYFEGLLKIIFSLDSNQSGNEGDQIRNFQKEFAQALWNGLSKPSFGHVRRSRHLSSTNSSIKIPPSPRKPIPRILHSSISSEPGFSAIRESSRVFRKPLPTLVLSRDRSISFQSAIPENSGSSAEKESMLSDVSDEMIKKMIVPAANLNINTENDVSSTQMNDDSGDLPSNFTSPEYTEFSQLLDRIIVQKSQEEQTFIESQVFNLSDFWPKAEVEEEDLSSVNPELPPPIESDEEPPSKSLSQNHDSPLLISDNSIDNDSSFQSSVMESNSVDETGKSGLFTVPAGQLQKMSLKSYLSEGNKRIKNFFGEVPQESSENLRSSAFSSEKSWRLKKLFGDEVEETGPNPMSKFTSKSFPQDAVIRLSSKTKKRKHGIDAIKKKLEILKLLTSHSSTFIDLLKSENKLIDQIVHGKISIDYAHLRQLLEISISLRSVHGQVRDSVFEYMRAMEQRKAGSSTSGRSLGRYTQAIAASSSISQEAQSEATRVVTRRINRLGRRKSERVLILYSDKVRISITKPSQVLGQIIEQRIVFPHELLECAITGKTVHMKFSTDSKASDSMTLQFEGDLDMTEFKAFANKHLSIFKEVQKKS